jgi:DNA oxidative demethylase
MALSGGDLFGSPEGAAPLAERLGPGTTLLHGLALRQAPAILAEVARIGEQAPLRKMCTPGGLTMSVAMTNCGTLGWVSDRSGYRYATEDPASGRPWPAMPEAFLALARDAAARAGFPGFVPDACLINQYQPGTRLSLHQDRNERDFTAPIVSVSLGLAVVFLLGGLSRAERAGRILLTHGDVLVWGGPDRLRYHGVLPLQTGCHPLVGPFRINLTLRKAG